MTEQKRNPYILRAGEDSVVVPRRIAALVDRELAGLRTRVRGVDPEATAVLEGIRELAMQWRGSATGTDVDPEPEPATELKQWLNTGEVAELLGITSRAVRKAIARGAIQAKESDGRYRVSREDAEHFRAARVA